jgi:ankyrin repeat protein
LSDVIFQAIGKGDMAQVSALIAGDAALARARKDGVSAILYARYCCKPDIVAVLRPHCGALDIFEASALGERDRVRALADAAPALADAVAPDGFGPLGLAAFFGHEKVVALLLARGADPAKASANAMKVMPLHAAAAARSVPIARTLIAAGAPLDARQGTGAAGFTPLMEAALNGQDELVELLLRHGANPDLRDDKEMSAADHARAGGHEVLARRLESAAGVA